MEIQRPEKKFMLHFIVNPHAKNIKKVVKEFKGRLDGADVPYELYEGESRGEMMAYVRKISEAGEKRIVAVGGDGTLNDVMNALSDPCGTELGLIPAGTGNDFAEAAKIPFGAAALDLILHSEAKETDYLDCGGKRSLNIAGLGIDVDVLERCYKMKRGSDRGKYFRALLSSLIHYRGQRVKVTADGAERELTALIAVACNGTQFGGGIPIDPLARMDDGKIDLLLVALPKRWKIPFYLVKLMRGKAPFLPIVERMLCEEVTVEQADGEFVQLDGELVRSKLLSCKIVHGKLKVYRG